MNQTEHQKLQTVDRYSKYQFLKRILLFILPFSLCSLFLCYSSGLYFCPHSLNFYFSSFIFSLFTNTLERKYMFLICNGILAFLSKSSVSCSSSPSGSDLGGELSASDLYKMKAPAAEEEAPVKGVWSLKNVAIVAEDMEEEEGEAVAAAEEAEEQKEQGNEPFYIENEQEESESLIKQEEEDEVEEPAAANEELASTDELNKKFEEFIRKMKEEIRIEAQQQLIAV